MPRFFADDFDKDSPVLSGEDARHIGYSLRMRTGEQLTVCARGIDYLCEIAEITRDEVCLTCLSESPCAAEADISLTLYQAMPKLDKFETILQKATELGAVRVVPVITSRCIARPDKQSFEKKRDRLEKIVKNAAMQSGRGMIPQVGELLTLSEAIAKMQQADTALVLYESGGARLSEQTFGTNIALLIGSEGGFAPEEIESAKAAGITPIWLGARILRCETAPLAAISVVMHATGNL